SPTPAPAPPAPVTIDEALARTTDDGTVLLRLTVARAHPLGPRIEPFVLAWPGWGSTLRAVSAHPLQELDWIEVVGPKDADRERLAVKTAVGDDVIDARLGARSDGTLRVVVRPRPHLVVAGPPDAAASIAAILARGALVEPTGELTGDEGEALHVDLPHPHDAVPEVPADATRLVVRVYSRPGGAAEGFASMQCADAATATHVAEALRARVDSVNGVVARLLTHDLLGELVITTEGDAVDLRLPATREQLEALATLASALLADGMTTPPG
ncbi:MAG: hypothetical protein ACRELB_24110, partial [Polyangiaceae bacterium]